jgi:hypothetical protein
MVDLVVTVITAGILYLAPGYAVLQLVDLQHTGKLTRFFLALCLSLVVVPYTFQVVGNIFPFVPGVIGLALLVLILFAAGWLLKRFRTRPVIHLGSDEGQPNPISLIEQVGVCLFIVLFSSIALLPRLDMFLHGAQAQLVAPGDETWHLAELISVARTGIPPHHYFFPTLKLSYYYASWIYPAIIGNLPFIEVSLARAMAIHAYLQVFAFLGAVYCYLRFNCKDWWVRLTGLGFFTIMGGFDLYTSISTPNLAEWWQKNAGWLVSTSQISQFVTLYDWVPQHLAGGMAFILGLLAWKNLQSSMLIKVILSGVLLGFCFTTSPFVFLAFSIAGGLFILFNLYLHLKKRQVELKPNLIYLGLFVVLILVVSWYSILVFSERSSSLAFNSLRVPIVGFILGENLKSGILDHLLTILGFPVIAFWIGLIELGLPFVLYLTWLMKKFLSGEELFNNGFDFVMVIFPSLYLLLTFLIVDVGGGGNFSMRGMIPAQILICFSGLLALEPQTDELSRRVWKRWLFAYIFACFLVAQGVSAYAQVRSDSILTMKQIMQAGYTDKTSQKNKSINYIDWLNANSPRNALILEDGCLTNGDADAYRRLERSRFISPDCSEKIARFQRDADFILNDEWHTLYKSAGESTDILALYNASSYWLKGQIPVYLVSWGSNPKWDGLGHPVYHDKFVSIYRVP